MEFRNTLSISTLSQNSTNKYFYPDLAAMLREITIRHSLWVAEILTFVFCFGFSCIHAHIHQIHCHQVRKSRRLWVLYYCWHKDVYVAVSVAYSKKICRSLHGYHKWLQSLKHILTSSPVDHRSLYRAWDRHGHGRRRPCSRCLCRVFLENRVLINYAERRFRCVACRHQIDFVLLYCCDR